MTLCSYSLSFILLMSSVLSGNFLFLITVQCFNVMLNLCYSYTCLLFDLINIFETFFHCEHLVWFIGWHNNSNFYLSLLLDLSISLVFNPSCICINYKNLFIRTLYHSAYLHGQQYNVPIMFCTSVQYTLIQSICM